MLLRSLNHVGIATRDLDATLAFYVEIFDATVKRFDREHAFIHLGEGDTVLHVFERPGPVDSADPGSFQHGPLDHLALGANDLDAFVDARERLRSRGVSDGDVIDFGPLVSLQFRDPDGLTQELSLWKPPDFDPPFATISFAGQPGGSG